MQQQPRGRRQHAHAANTQRLTTHDHMCTGTERLVTKVHIHTALQGTTEGVGVRAATAVPRAGPDHGPCRRRRHPLRGSEENGNNFSMVEKNIEKVQ